MRLGQEKSEDKVSLAEILKLQERRGWEKYLLLSVQSRRRKTNKARTDPTVLCSANIILEKSSVLRKDSKRVAGRSAGFKKLSLDGGSVGWKINWINLNGNLELLSHKDSETEEGENKVSTESKFRCGQEGQSYQWRTGSSFGTDNLSNEH